VLVDYIIGLLGDHLNPSINLNARILASTESEGCSLDMGDWHSCETTHCRGGWAIHNHSIGYELEKYFGPWMAGAIIYKKSTGHIPDFHASKDDAMADLRKRAEEETAP